MKIRRLLLQFNLGTSFFKLGLGCFGSILGNSLEDVHRSAFNKLLGIGKTESGSNFTHSLDDSDLVGSCFSEDDVEVGLLLGSFGFGWCCGYGNTCWRCSGDAPRFFKVLN